MRALATLRIVKRFSWHRERQLVARRRRPHVQRAHNAARNGERVRIILRKVIRNAT